MKNKVFIDDLIDLFTSIELKAAPVLQCTHLNTCKQGQLYKKGGTPQYKKYSY